MGEIYHVEAGWWLLATLELPTTCALHTQAVLVEVGHVRALNIGSRCVVDEDGVINTSPPFCLLSAWWAELAQSMCFWTRRRVLVPHLLASLHHLTASLRAAQILDKLVQVSFNVVLCCCVLEARLVVCVAHSVGWLSLLLSALLVDSWALAKVLVG